MVIEKPKLFTDSKIFVLFVLLMLALIGLRLLYLHHSYQDFISKPFYYTTVKVLNVYQKTRNGRSYTVLKAQSDEGLTFFTSTSRKDDFSNKILRLQVYPNERIGFFDYLGYFYVKSKIKNIQAVPLDGIKQNLLQKVSSQHADTSISSFYNAIFFATPLPKELREKIAMLGVSHLVALSGFHLGILWILMYGILSLLYKPLQQRYFPYRFMLADVGFVAIICLGAYVWFVDFPPSLVRSYAMVLVGWLAVLAGIELISFTFITTVVLFLIALFPSLLASLSFALSVAGVFYIFLLLRYAQNINKWIISLLIIPFGIFVLMLPMVHYIFAVTTPYQLLSPILSILFTPFYPIAMALHFLGIGYLMDDVLLYLFNLPRESVDYILPLGLFAGYIVLSVWAIWSRVVFYLLVLSALVYAVYLFW